MDDGSNAAKILINPFSVITFKDELFRPHEIEGSLEDWVRKNAELIHEIGKQDWLEELLRSLTAGTPPEYVHDVIISPFKGMMFSDQLRGEHDAIVERAVWIKANVKMIDELGVEPWLWRLVEVLESGPAS